MPPQRNSRISIRIRGQYIFTRRVVGNRVIITRTYNDLIWLFNNQEYSMKSIPPNVIDSDDDDDNPTPFRFPSPIIEENT